MHPAVKNSEQAGQAPRQKAVLRWQQSLKTWSTHGRSCNDGDEETGPFLRDGCRLAGSDHGSHVRRCRSLSDAPRHNHQSIRSRQHFGCGGPPHGAIAARSAGAVLYRGEQGGCRRSGRCYGGSRAIPDGYTLLATASSFHSAAALYKDLPIDPLKDFTHIARIGSYPSFIAVRSSLPVNSIQELVAYAKNSPGKLTYGHGNNLGQMIGEILKRRTGIDIARAAYRSNPAAMTDLVGGHIDIMVPDLNTGMPHVRSGMVRPLAVFTKQRSATLPDVPTLDETVMPGFEILAWGGLSGPSNLPDDVVTTLGSAVHKALMNP